MLSQCHRMKVIPALLRKLPTEGCGPGTAGHRCDCSRWVCRLPPACLHCCQGRARSMSSLQPPRRRTAPRVTPTALGLGHTSQTFAYIFISGSRSRRGCLGILLAVKMTVNYHPSSTYLDHRHDLLRGRGVNGDTVVKVLLCCAHANGDAKALQLLVHTGLSKLATKSCCRGRNKVTHADKVQTNDPLVLAFANHLIG